MTGLIILTFIPLFAAVFFFIRMRDEQKAKYHAELRARQPDQRSTGVGGDLLQWNAVLGHELRSPIAAILGYQELIEEGTFGELPPAAVDVLGRMRLAAAQLLLLVEGVERSGSSVHVDPPSTFRARDLIHDSIANVRFDADSRKTILHVEDTDAELHTARSDASRALVLILGAAVKVSPGATLTISVRDGDLPRISIAGANLDHARDSAGPDTPLTGAGLRLELARAAARHAGGTVDVDASGTVHLHLPRSGSDPGTEPIDGAEHLP